MKQPKRKFNIIHRGRIVGTSWAVSAAKAINNYWWNNCKGRDQYAYTDYRPSDFSAVEA